MAIPIPRISWGDGYTITAGVNDLVFFEASPPLDFCLGKIAPGVYATPETLLAAVDDAIESAVSKDGSFVSLGGASSSALAAGFVAIQLSGVTIWRSPATSTQPWAWPVWW